MIMCPWLSYLVAEGIGFSGIVAILTNGLILNIYATPNISRGSKKVLKITYETIGFYFPRNWCICILTSDRGSKSWSNNFINIEYKFC